MQVAYHANNIIDAHLAKHLLEEGGVPAFVFGESLVGGVGELAAGGFLQVCIPEGYEEQAAAALRSLVEGDLSADLEAGFDGLPEPA